MTRTPLFAKLIRAFASTLVSHLSPHNMTLTLHLFMWFNFLQPLSVGSRTDLSFSLYLSPVQWHKSPIPLWCTETSFVEQQGSIGWDCVFVISSLDHIPTKQTYQRFHNRRNEALFIIFVYNQLTPSLQSSKIREFASEYLKCSLLLLEQSRFYYTLLYYYIAHPNFSLPIPTRHFTVTLSCVP